MLHLLQIEECGFVVVCFFVLGGRGSGLVLILKMVALVWAVDVRAKGLDVLSPFYHYQ